jgi:hypothetical protein
MDVVVAYAANHNGSAFPDGAQNYFGSLHYAYLYILAPRTPAPLRRVDGFPVLGLLWGLRSHRARAP